MTDKHVFVVGLDPFNLEKLQNLPQATECEFHAALDITDIRGVDRFDMRELIERAERCIENSGHRPDAVVTFWDFPATDLAPILCKRYGLRSPTLEAVLKCEHKYWSRCEQARAIPGNVPAFQAFDPFDDHAFEKVHLVCPYWIKPVKSFRSFLAYRINDERGFNDAIADIRQNIGYMNEPFQYLLDHYEMPEAIASMKESCIAESLLSGSQCTLEGYVFNGEVVPYGVVDSVRENDRSSFSRYEYPSSLPSEVQWRMGEITRRAIKAIGLDNSCFNIEFFYNQTQDHIYLLEINPRLSQAHSDLFEKVHGVAHQRVMLDVALGRKPRPLAKDGDFGVAAHFMPRVFETGTVRRVPTADEIAQLEDEIPGLHLKIKVREGMHLDELQGQDSYSYELASVYIGAESQVALLDRYDRLTTALRFEIEPDTPDEHAPAIMTHPGE